MRAWQSNLAGLTRADWRALVCLAAKAPRRRVRPADAERLIERGLAEVIWGEAVLTAAGHQAVSAIGSAAEPAPAVTWRTRAQRSLAEAASGRSSVTIA